MRPRFETVRATHRDGSDVWTLEIEPAGGFEFLPGQFNMLYAHGVGEAAISISGDPSEPGRLIHTIRAVGKVSEALTRLAPGDQVGIRGPFGRGWPMEEAEGKDVGEAGKTRAPENGREDGRRLTPIEGGNRLGGRGSIGPFGRTQTWVRVN